MCELSNNKGPATQSDRMLQILWKSLCSGPPNHLQPQQPQPLTGMGCLSSPSFSLSFPGMGSSPQTIYHLDLLHMYKEASINTHSNTMCISTKARNNQISINRRMYMYMMSNSHNGIPGRHEDEHTTVM